jgi:integrase
MINTLRKRGRIYWLKYRAHAERGKPQEVSLGTSDKQVAEKRRSEFVAEKEREQAGILAPKEMRVAAQRSLSDHIEDFVTDIRARGKAEKYADNIEMRLNRLVAECGWKTVRDVGADSFAAWRARQKMAPKTLNEYLNAASGLLNWMQRSGRIPANPLKVVGKVEMRGRETRRRRALALDELRRFLQVSGSRKAVYLTAVYTGLRRGELEQLEWTDIHLDDVAQPFIEVRASTTKNHEKATIKLHSDVVAALREKRAMCDEADERVFTVPKIETFRADLDKAGIPYRDEQGRVADFHSLRVTLCTNLHNAGVPERTAMEMMRHSDRRLTDKVYTDTSKLHTWSAVDKLPSVLQTNEESLSQILSQNSVAGGQSVSLPVIGGDTEDTQIEAVDIDECRGQSFSVTTGQDEKWRAQQELNLQPLVP